MAEPDNYIQEAREGGGREAEEEETRTRIRSPSFASLLKEKLKGALAQRVAGVGRKIKYKALGFSGDDVAETTLALLAKTKHLEVSPDGYFRVEPRYYVPGLWMLYREWLSQVIGRELDLYNAIAYGLSAVLLTKCRRIYANTQSDSTNFLYSCNCPDGITRYLVLSMRAESPGEAKNSIDLSVYTDYNKALIEYMRRGEFTPAQILQRTFIHSGTQRTRGAQPIVFVVSATNNAGGLENLFRMARRLNTVGQ